MNEKIKREIIPETASRTKARREGEKVDASGLEGKENGFNEQKICEERK